MDIKSRSERSENMSRIRSKDTKPEIIVRRFLYVRGMRYRCNVRSLPGKPDIAIKKHCLAIFVNGCFWHGHENCRNFRIPKSNIEFWTKKIFGNLERDKKNIDLLVSQGYKVITIWECEVEDRDFSKLELALAYVTEENRLVPNHK